MTNQTWLDDEPGLGAALRESATLLGEGLRHGWLMLSSGVLLAALIAGSLFFGKHDYAPRLVLRVVEAKRESVNLPQMKGQLAEYVRQAVFTSQPLFELIRRYDLYPKLMTRNSRAALDSFREDISVDVYQNYFVQDRPAGAMPRSAHLSVRYRSANKDLALAVTRDLGTLIIERELAARREQALAAAADADHARDASLRALEERSQAILSKQGAIEQGLATPREQVELVGLLGSLGALERRAEVAEHRANALDLNAESERHGVGLHFELVDDASLPSGQDELRTRLLLAGSSFVFGMPLLAIALGAFTRSRGGT